MKGMSAAGGWSDWTTLRHWDGYSVPVGLDPPIISAAERVDIGQIADQSRIQLRFHFYEAEWDYWFAFDNVIVSGEAGGRIKSITLSGGRATLDWTVFGSGEYTVQQTESLIGATWSNAPGSWPIGGETWTSGDVSGKKMLIYRIMSWP